MHMITARNKSSHFSHQQSTADSQADQRKIPFTLSPPHSDDWKEELIPA